MIADLGLSRLSIRILAGLASVAAALVLATPPPAGAEPGDGGTKKDDNTAVAINEEDGSTVLDFAFSIRRVAGDVVENQNAAVALASCESCQTVAVAIQIVLVESTPSTVTPINAAIALNEECTACTTVALAYQYVLGVGEPLRFTKEGRERIREIREEFKSLERGDLPLDQILARVAELRADLVDVLNTQLETRSDRGEDGGGGEGEGPSGAGADEGAGEGSDEQGGPGPGGADGSDAGSGGGEPTDDSGAEPSTSPDGGGSAEEPAAGAEAPAGGSGESAP